MVVTFPVLQLIINLTVIIKFQIAKEVKVKLKIDQLAKLLSKFVCVSVTCKIQEKKSGKLTYIDLLGSCVNSGRENGEPSSAVGQLRG